ncbi:substrate-binding domain-containing protein [Paraburkholderia ferrariae]|jgi:DNA-binding LacI/PurR family transcriptional regulator
MAPGLVKAAREPGFRLPQGVSVAGFDNAPDGEYASRALTSVDFQREQI